MNITLRLVALLALALTGFGCDDEGADVTVAGSGGAASDERPTIGISIPAADHGWTGGVVYWANQAKKDLAEEADIQVVTAASPEEQIGQIESLLARGVDGMVILATESAPLTPTAKKVAERGVYLVNVDRGFTEPVADVYVAGDNAEFGRKSAEFVVEQMGGQGKLLILTGIPSTVDSERVEAAMPVFAEHENIEVLDKQPGNWSREDAMNATAAMLQKYPRVDAIWAQDDDMAEGVEQAAREAGRLDGLFIFGGAGKKEIVKRVMENDPTYPATITYPPAMIYAGAAMASAKLNGKPISDAAERAPQHLGLTAKDVQAAKAEAGDDGTIEITLPVRLVTPNNAEEFYFPESAY